MSFWAICLHQALVGARVLGLAVGVIAGDLTLATAQMVPATTGAINGIVTDTTRADRACWSACRGRH